jgi:hypothetical protein
MRSMIFWTPRGVRLHFRAIVGIDGQQTPSGSFALSANASATNLSDDPKADAHTAVIARMLILHPLAQGEGFQ